MIYMHIINWVKYMKLFKLINDEEKKNKKIFIFLTVLLIIGFIAGTLYITILSNADKDLIRDTITNYFMQIKKNKLNSVDLFRQATISNFIYVIGIWLLGISIIGLPIIIGLVFYKSFIMAFSITSIIFKYKFSGILLSFTYSFPYQLLNIIIISFISLYAIKVSLSIIKMMISKKTINFKRLIKKYFVVLLICLFLSIISSLIEGFITPYLIKLLSVFIK